MSATWEGPGDIGEPEWSFIDEGATAARATCPVTGAHLFVADVGSRWAWLAVSANHRAERAGVRETLLGAQEAASAARRDVTWSSLVREDTAQGPPAPGSWRRGGMCGQWRKGVGRGFELSVMPCFDAEGRFRWRLLRDRRVVGNTTTATEAQGVADDSDAAKAAADAAAQSHLRLSAAQV